MSYRKTAAVAALTAATPQALGSVALGAPYARVLGFQIRNWASSAKAAAGADVLQRVKLVDADSRTFYLDAADADYATAAKFVFFQQDETATGLSDLKLDATGAALSSQGTDAGAVVKSPVAVSIINGGTVTDYAEVYLFVEV